MRQNQGHKMDFLIINGPNLNMLGVREPDIYGHDTLDDLQTQIKTHFADAPHKFTFIQSNHEGVLIDAIHATYTQKNIAIIINAGAFTHTSVAIADALSGCKHPIIEVHISNVYRRESFRHHSFISAIADGVICGLGFYGYIAAIESVIKKNNLL